MKKISLQSLIDADFGDQAFINFYEVNNFDDVDWDSVRKINFNDSEKFMLWFCETFYLSITNIDEKTGFSFEFDDNNNLIHKRHYEEDEGFTEEWYKYDDKNNKIYSRNETGFEDWTDFDENGNIIHFKNSLGYETWRKYDKRGNKIYNKENVLGTKDFESWFEYDSKNRLIYYKDSNGLENWSDYDQAGNLIRFRTSDGRDDHYEYNEDGTETTDKIDTQLGVYKIDRSKFFVE